MELKTENNKEDTTPNVLGLLGGKKRDLTSTLTDPISQPAQKAIWSCDEAGNLGAVCKNPGGGKFTGALGLPQRR